jgi:FMN reductase
VLIGHDTLVQLPHYRAPGTQTGPAARSLIDEVRGAHGLILASPGYHGSISGLVKNALDYLEETARGPRPYLDGMPVGLISTAYGWQAACTTLTAMRAIVHALRGWPTPFGAAINSSDGALRGGAPTDPALIESLERVAAQVVSRAADSVRTAA